MRRPTLGEELRWRDDQFGWPAPQDRRRLRPCPKCSRPRSRMLPWFHLDAYRCRWGHTTTGLELAQAGLL